MILTFLLLPLLLVGCMHNSEVKGLSVEERHLLDARYDHLRCEIKLDRLRDLYDVTEEEPHGLMDNTLEANNETGTPGSDKPLVGGHDSPLIGGHDRPLTGGHDSPLTGGHDYLDALRGATKASADLCWDAVAVLYNTYNSCVVDFLNCKENSATPENCLAIYKACVTSKHPPSSWED
jgi:hypothetical protein